jgi:hypothetical protein
MENYQDYQRDFTISANKCARFIYDDPRQRESYEAHIHLGKNPRDHIYFHAAYVLNKDDELDIDIDYYEEITNS